VDGTDVGMSAIGTDYFATVGGALLHGRDFSVGDTAGSPLVAIVNETMARRFWDASDAVGRRFRLGEADGPLVEVVGIARDGKYGTIGEQQRPYMYLPVEQDSRFSRLKPGVTLVVHGTGEPSAMIAAVRGAIGRLDPDLGTFGAMTMAEHVENALNLARTSATLAGAFGICALILSLVGIYGVVSYSVARRTREVGIRIALGAGPAEVVRLVFRDGIGPAGVGMAAGLAAAFAVTGLVRGMLYDVSPHDVSVFVLIPLVLASAAAAATYIPARRALRVDPINALRSE
jgi:predicted permease